jgi:hypothetical protein
VESNGEVSEEFKKRVEKLCRELLNYEDLKPHDKALYDFIVDICEEEDTDEDKK